MKVKFPLAAAATPSLHYSPCRAFGMAALKVGCAAIALSVASIQAAPLGTKGNDDTSAANLPTPLFQPQTVSTNGAVTIAGKRLEYKAVAGTLVIHGPNWDDTSWRAKSEKDLADRSNADPEASIFYAAYFKNGAPGVDRPITFFYNGGPGSSTVWLHMGGFGPKRVVTSDNSHTPAAPYSVVNNETSLLDRSDVVFIDAPGTGFSRVAGKDKEKAFYGVDADANAFAQFIKAFLTKYDRWNSPKYLFGESYGTPRSAVLINKLTTDEGIDFNGVILLSQFLDLSLLAEYQGANPNSVVGYVTQIPTFAATAWYHNALPGDRPADLKAFLAEVEKFATTDYAAALIHGSQLDSETRKSVAKRFANYTGLSVEYILKADLRVDGPEFAKELQRVHGLTTGRLDSRFSGPELDPLAKNAEYYPDSAALTSAYVSTFNAYVRNDLHYDAGLQFKASSDVLKDWDFKHEVAGYPALPWSGVNVMPDLAQAMKHNPQLKVLVAGGYYDLVTPYFQGLYEMRHLPIPLGLQKNIEHHYYESGHMVYANRDAARKLHDDVANFIDRTSNVSPVDH